MCPCKIRGTDDRTNIMWIFQFIKKDNERCLPLLFCQVKNVIQLRIGIRCKIGNDALVFSSF